jgi:hypothetical protein
MSTFRKNLTEKRLKRLKKRTEEEVYVFPKKTEYPLQRLVKKAKRVKPKTLNQQMKEWEKFKEMTE